MGGQVCGEQKMQDSDKNDTMPWLIEVDKREKGVEHTDDIKCRNKGDQELINELVKTLKIEKSLYKDPSMPTDPIILRSKTAEIKCTYERPYKFLDDAVRNSDYKLIDFHEALPDTIQVKDEVMQYFGVFLCFLSDKTNLIQKIITTNENSYGLHCIEAYRHGKPIHFLIDDYILCKDGKPIFTQPCKMRYMWPCLIEKAWLKMRGNLEKRVEQTSPEELFETFIPLPIQKFYLEEGVNASSKGAVFTLFENFDPKNKGYIITSKKNPEFDIGLSGRKHFYLLDTFKIGGKRLFYIRNPCVEMSFRGTYSQIPREVSEEIYKRNFMKIAAGNFVIDEDEFTEQMGEIMVVNCLPGNKISTCGFTASNTQEFFIGFTLKFKGQLNLKITQTQISPDRNQNLYPLLYHVLRISDQNQKIIGGLENKEGCFGVKHTYLLDNFSEQVLPGKYIIRLKKKQYEHSLPKILTFITAYYMDKVDFDIVTTEQMSEKWQSFLVAECKRRMEVATDKGKGDISHVVCWLGDLVAIYVQKTNTKKAQVQIEVNFPELMNLECISHPQVRRSNDWKTYTISDHLMFVFEKIDLTAQTQIRQYHLESF